LFAPWRGHGHAVHPAEATIPKGSRTAQQQRAKRLRQAKCVRRFRIINKYSCKEKEEPLLDHSRGDVSATLFGTR